MITPKKPPIEDRHQYLMTREEARARGLDFYYTGRPCQGHYGQHDDYRYAKTGGCVECKRLDNARQRIRRWRATPSGKALTKKRHANVKSLGLRRGNMPGGGKGYYELIPQQAIARPDDRETNRAVRVACPRKYQRDHKVPQPEAHNFPHAIIGLECAENLQILSASENRKKGGALPDPDDHTRAAERPLALEELRWFIQHRMAIWAKDVTFATKPGERAKVRWELYRFGPGGLVEYLGAEPLLVEAAE